MFYRRLDDKLFTSADLTGAYEGSPLFILGGNPSLKRLPLNRLERSRLPTMAMNNVVFAYPNPTLWLTADKPACYASHFFARPDIIKFGYMNYRDDVVPATGKPFKEHPMMLFYTAFEADEPSDFFAEVPGVAWWKSVFPIALQIAWRLGVRRVYLAGCSFVSSNHEPYAWGTKLSPFQAKWSQITYSEDLVRLKQFAPLFAENGFKVFSCTPDSPANQILTHIMLEDAINYELSLMPARVSPLDVKHSSDFRPQRGA